MRLFTLAMLVAAGGCAPAPVSYRAPRTPLPPMREEPAAELSPPGLPAVVVAEVASPEREVLFARNRDRALIATRSNGQWLVGPVRLDRKGGEALAPTEGHGGLRSIHAAPERTPAALERSGDGFLLAWVEAGSSGEESISLLRLDASGAPRGDATIVGKSAQPVDWLQLLSEADRTFVLWDAQRGPKRTIEVAALTGDALTTPTELDGGRGWHAVATREGLWFASAIGSATSGGVAISRLSVAQGALTVEHRVLRDSASTLGDVQLAAMAGGRALAAWTERHEGDLRVVVGGVGPDGAVGVPRPVAKLGGQALVGLAASGDGSRAVLGWERERDAQVATRSIELVTLLPDGAPGGARGELVFQASADMPQLLPDGAGFAALTLASIKTTADAAEEGPVGPTFVRLDGELRVRSSEPVRLADFSGESSRHGLPAFVHSPDCAGGRCTVVARGDAVPSLLAIAEIPVRETRWTPAVRPRPPSEPPVAEELRTLVDLDASLADFSAADLPDGRTVLAWLEESSGGRGAEETARLRVTIVGADGRAGEVVTLSEKASALGGVDVEPLGSGTEGVAAIAWVGPNDGAQVYVTRIGAKGEKLDQRSVTAIPRGGERGKGTRGAAGATEVTDVELARDPRGGTVCAWSDTRSGEPAVFLARLDGKLERKGTDVRVSSGQGAASEPRLAVLGERMLVAWSETADGAEQGEIHLATVETASLKIVERGHPLARSSGHSRTPSFAPAPDGVVLSWLDEAGRAPAPPGEPDGEPPPDDTPGLRLLALDRQGRPLAQLSRLALEGEPTSVAVRCDDGACRVVSAALDGADLRLDALSAAFASSATPLRRPLVGLPGGTRGDVRLTLGAQAGKAYFAQPRGGRTLVRELTLRWSR